MAVHNMHVGTVLYFAAAFAIGLTLVILAAILNGQISGDCNNTVKHSISGVFGLGVTLVIISILMFIIDHYCACSSAVGLFGMGVNMTNVGFFAALTMIISIAAITLGAIIDTNIDEKCGKNVNKNLAKYIWVGGIVAIVISIVVLIAHKTRKFVGDTDNDDDTVIKKIQEYDSNKIKKEAKKKKLKELEQEKAKAEKAGEEEALAEHHKKEEIEERNFGNKRKKQKEEGGQEMEMQTFNFGPTSSFPKSSSM